MASAASSEAQAPVIFENFGMIPDVRLKVFDLEIQVHSGVLKEHSAFFRRFLDPANKEEESSVASGPFKYEWISKVDEDGSWGLVSVGSGDDDNASKLTTALKEKEKVTFRTLLKVMYKQYYEIPGVNAFADLVKMADYYCALPCLSSSILMPMRYSAEFVNGIERHASALLPYAQKIRQPELFRECVIFIVGSLDGPYSHRSWGTRLTALVNKVYGQLCMELVGVHKLVLRTSYNSDAMKIKAGLEHTQYSLPAQYRSWAINNTYGISKYLRAILQNRLPLNRQELTAGLGSQTGKLLCARIDDKDLPWDRSQIDW